MNYLGNGGFATACFAVLADIMASKSILCFIAVAALALAVTTQVPDCIMKKSIIQAFARCSAILLSAALCISCVPQPSGLASKLALSSLPSQANSFQDYKHDQLQMIKAHRSFQGEDQELELHLNAPREWRPHGVPRAGVLLVHGLGDSPWSFHDIGAALAERGYLARTVLLPGHGTRPENMLDVKLEDWQEVVEKQANLLSKEVPRVLLGGFSTGANLVLEFAMLNTDVAGLLLFSPAFKSDSKYDWLTPWIAWARPWLRESDGVRPLQTTVRYMTVPTNGFAQFYRSSRQVRQKLKHSTFNKPVFMAVAEHDSVLDTAYLAETFSARFTSPHSKLIWYGTALQGKTNADPRVVLKSDSVPEMRISQFSHMGLLFSPSNPLYGINGSSRICWNGQGEKEMELCERGAPVWLSDWGYIEEGRIHARLTFNPFFDLQTRLMLDVVESSL